MKTPKYAIYENGELVALIDSNLGIGTRISDEEYKRLAAEIQEREMWVNRVCADPLIADSVPKEMKGEIMKRVEQRKQLESEREAEAQTADISPEELGAMLMEVM